MSKKEEGRNKKVWIAYQCALGCFSVHCIGVDTIICGQFIFTEGAFCRINTSLYNCTIYSAPQKVAPDTHFVAIKTSCNADRSLCHGVPPCFADHPSSSPRSQPQFAANRPCRAGPWHRLAGRPSTLASQRRDHISGRVQSELVAGAEVRGASNLVCDAAAGVCRFACVCRLRAIRAD